MFPLRALAAGLLALGTAACAETQRSASADPPGTAVERTIDRAAGTNTSGAFPLQSDGMPGNPPGTAVDRAIGNRR